MNVWMVSDRSSGGLFEGHAEILYPQCPIVTGSLKSENAPSQFLPSTSAYSCLERQMQAFKGLALFDLPR